MHIPRTICAAMLALCLSPARALAAMSVPSPQPAYGVKVTDYGAVCDGATSDSAAFNAAVASGNVAIHLPPGKTCAIASTITMTMSNVGLICDVLASETHSIGSPPLTGCHLKWTGASAGTMISIVAPSGSTSKGVLTGNFVRGVYIDGNGGLAANGLLLEAVRAGAYDDLYFAGFDGGTVLDLNEPAVTSSTFGDQPSDQFNVLSNIAIDQYGHTSTALHLGSYLDATLGSNASFNTIVNLDVAHYTGKCIVLDGADNNTFINARCYQSGSGVHAVDFNIYSRAGLYYPANSNHFHGLSVNGPIYAQGQTAFPGCVAYTAAFGATSCTMGNVIDGLDKLNGTPDPTIEAGAQVVWYDSTGPTGNATGGPLGLGDSYYASLAATAACGTCTLYVRNGSADNIVLDDGSSNTARLYLNGGNVTLGILSGGGTNGGAVVTDVATQTVTNKSIAASEINSGVLSPARLPNPSASSLGGVESIAPVTHNFVTSISTSGVPAQAQQALADVSGLDGTASQGQVTVNRNSAALPAPPSASTVLQVASVDGIGTAYLADSFAGLPQFNCRRADGTNGSKTAIQNAENICQLGMYGYGTTGYSTVARAVINAVAAENWTDVAQGTFLKFVTTKPGTTTLVVGLQLDGYGHWQASASLTPAVSACGTGSPSVSGNDVRGVITTGAGAPTACTLTFANAYATAPICTVTTSATAALPAITANSTGAFTVGLSAGLTSGSIYYTCIG